MSERCIACGFQMEQKPLFTSFYWHCNNCEKPKRTDTPPEYPAWRKFKEEVTYIGKLSLYVTNDSEKYGYQFGYVCDPLTARKLSGMFLFDTIYIEDGIDDPFGLYTEFTRIFPSSQIIICSRYDNFEGCSI